MSKNKLIVHKLVVDKYYIEVDRKVLSALIQDIDGLVWTWQHSFTVYCSDRSAYDRLSHAGIKIRSVTSMSDSDTTHGWRYSIEGEINMPTPFSHTSVVKELARILG